MNPVVAGLQNPKCLSSLHKTLAHQHGLDPR